MNDRLKNITVSILFLVLIIGLMFINIFTKDNKISISERRNLEQFPKLTFNTLIDGTFFDRFDKYTTDQFIKRDDFRLLKAKIELKTKHNYNNLYLYNDYIVSNTYPLNEKSIIRVTDKINYIKDNYLDETNKIYYSIIPDKNYFINDNNLKLDYNKLQQIMKNNLSSLNYINIFPLLSLDDYYKTDTHWKQESLEKVVNYFSKEMNFLTSSYDVKTVDEFNGVYYYQLPVKTLKDYIKILTNDAISNSYVYNYETFKKESVYNLDKLNSLDKYDVYLSGAVPLIDIVNEDSLSNKELVVFRDSYGSSLIPLFINGYKKITVVDTRYISPKILNNYIDFKNKDVLFIYGVILINDSISMK